MSAVDLEKSYLIVGDWLYVTCMVCLLSELQNNSISVLDTILRRVYYRVVLPSPNVSVIGSYLRLLITRYCIEVCSTHGGQKLYPR